MNIHSTNSLSFLAHEEIKEPSTGLTRKEATEEIKEPTTYSKVDVVRMSLEEDIDISLHNL